MLRRQLTNPGLMHVCRNGNFLCQGLMRGQRCVAEAIGVLRMADSVRYRNMLCVVAVHQGACTCTGNLSCPALGLSKEKDIEYYR